MDGILYQETIQHHEGYAADAHRMPLSCLERCDGTPESEPAGIILASRITTDLPSEHTGSSRIDVPRCDGKVEHDRVRAGELRRDWAGGPEIRIPGKHHEWNQGPPHLESGKAHASNRHSQPSSPRKLRCLR